MFFFFTANYVCNSYFKKKNIFISGHVPLTDVAFLMRYDGSLRANIIHDHVQIQRYQK